MAFRSVRAETEKDKIAGVEADLEIGESQSGGESVPAPAEESTITCRPRRYGPLIRIN